MRWAALLWLLLGLSAHAAEVAKVFGVPVSDTELGLTDEKSLPQAARQLKDRVLKEALPRFVAANNLQATPEDIAGYQRWEAGFRKADLKRREERLAELERALKGPGLDGKKRAALGEQRDVLLSLKRHDAARPPDNPALAARLHAQWIEAYKVRKALYEKYGGRVGITKWGPDPAGATEVLLREHEKKGELQVMHAGLAREFWAQLAREPRMPASRPEHYDFTYYWLKPVEQGR